MLISYSCRSYGAWRDKAARFYKHLAPTEPGARRQEAWDMLGRFEQPFCFQPHWRLLNPAILQVNESWV